MSINDNKSQRLGHKHPFLKIKISSLGYSLVKRSFYELMGISIANELWYHYIMKKRGDSMIYLDNAATTKPNEDVIQSYMQMNTQYYFNPNLSLIHI